MTETYSPDGKRNREPRAAETNARRRRRDAIDEDTRGLRLHVPVDLKDPGYEYRFVNDTASGRVQQLYAEDWDPVTDSRIEGAGEGSPVARHVGTAENGAGKRAVLMRKPKELHQEDQARKQRKLDELEESMKRAPLSSPEGLQPNEAYVPAGHRNIIGRAS